MMLGDNTVMCLNATEERGESISIVFVKGSVCVDPESLPYYTQLWMSYKASSSSPIVRRMYTVPLAIRRLVGVDRVVPES